MEKVMKGKAWKFGHDLINDTHIFAFSHVLEHNSGVPLEKLIHHVMEPVNPEFASGVRKGDFVVAGRNFGYGKAHRQGVMCFKMLGISAVIADSIGRGMLKNHLYFGLPALCSEGISDKINQGDELEVNVLNGEIKNLSTGETLRATPAFPPGHPLFPIMEAGGEVSYVKMKLATLNKLQKRRR